MRPITLVLLLCSLIISFPISSAFAQETNQEFRISVYRSKVTTDSFYADRFFNTTTLSFEYQHEIVDYLNAVVAIRFLQFIETEGISGKIIPPEKQRFSRSLLTFDIGIALIPVVIDNHFEVRFTAGPSLRHKNAVYAFMSFEFTNGEVLVKDRYISKWEKGGFFNVDLVYTFRSNWLLGIRGQMHVYSSRPNVFDVGLGFGKKF